MFRVSLRINELIICISVILTMSLSLNFMFLGNICHIVLLYFIVQDLHV